MTKKITIEEAGMVWMTEDDFRRLKKIHPKHSYTFPMAATPRFIEYLKKEVEKMSP